jgi:hypothetical protein
VGALQALVHQQLPQRIAAEQQDNTHDTSLPGVASTDIFDFGPFSSIDIGDFSQTQPQLNFPQPDLLAIMPDISNPNIYSPSLPQVAEYTSSVDPSGLIFPTQHEPSYRQFTIEPTTPASNLPPETTTGSMEPEDSASSIYRSLGPFLNILNGASESTAPPIQPQPSLTRTLSTPSYSLDYMTSSMVSTSSRRLGATKPKESLEYWEKLGLNTEIFVIKGCRLVAHCRTMMETGSISDIVISNFLEEVKVAVGKGTKLGKQHLCLLCCSGHLLVS